MTSIVLIYVCVASMVSIFVYILSHKVYDYIYLILTARRRKVHFDYVVCIDCIYFSKKETSILWYWFHEGMPMQTILRHDDIGKKIHTVKVDMNGNPVVLFKER